MGVTITVELRLKDNVIVGTRHNVKVSIIGKIIGDIYDKHSNIKYKNSILNNIVALPQSKFNLISTSMILKKDRHCMEIKC